MMTAIDDIIIMKWIRLWLCIKKSFPPTSHVHWLVLF